MVCCVFCGVFCSVLCGVLCDSKVQQLFVDEMVKVYILLCGVVCVLVYGVVCVFCCLVCGVCFVV